MGKKLQKTKKKKKKKKNGRKHSSHKKKENSVLIDSSQLIPIEDGEDRISDLPDDLLRHIVSLISYDSDSDSNGKTMLLLSTRWWDFWNRTLVQHEDGTVDAMAVSTLRFLASCTERGRALDCVRKLVFHSHGSGQVLVATMTRNKKLHMDFSHGQDDDDNNNSSVDWWASLWLMSRDLLCPQPSIIPPIVSISLTCVNFPSNDGIDVVSSLLSNVPSLHTIEIRGSKGLRDIDVPSDIGKRLISLSIIECQVNSIKINGSFSLRSFRYRGRCPSIIEIGISPYHIWRGLDLMLDLREGPLRINGPLKNLFKISPSLNLSTYLTMCQWTFEAMIRPTLYSPYAQFHYLTELWWIDNSMDEENIESLITFLKECHRLQKLFVTIDPECYHLPSSRRRKRNRPKYRQRYKLSCLNLVKMDGLEHEEDELLLAEEIFKITEAEPAVVATTRRRRYARKLVRVDPDGPRVFVRETDRERINTKHRHMSV